MKKKIVAVLLAACLALAPSLSSADELMDITRAAGYTEATEAYRPKSTLLIDGNTGDVLWEENADEVRDPASMSKAMTLYLVFEAMSKGEISEDTVITATPTDQAIADIYEISNNKIVAGVDYTVSELITMTAVPSSNVTTVMLANYLTNNDPDKWLDMMNEDLKQAYELAKVESDSLVPITPTFLKRMNAMLMRTTGSVHSVMGGSFDSSKGEFRLCGVTAGVGGHSYMNYLKVPAKVDELCAILQEKQKKMGTFREQYELSFNAHLNLVTIHPWVDGNGRTARLLMNYIQFCYHLFPTKIFKEDREAYILSLRQCQDEETNQLFLLFMAGQLKKSLSLEIERFKASQKKGFCFMF